MLKYYVILHTQLQREQTCVYEYSVEQQYFGQEGLQNVTVSSTVEITCHSGEQKLNSCMKLFIQLYM